MKTYILLSVLLLFSSFSCYEKESKQHRFKVEIKEESMLWLNTCVVTYDSIRISKTNRPESKTDFFALKLTKEESAELEKLFSNINLKTLKQNYTNPEAPADFYAYNFTFASEDNLTRTVYVYQYRQEEIFKLVQKVNQVISAHGVEYQLGYNEAYFQHKK